MIRNARSTAAARLGGARSEITAPPAEFTPWTPPRTRSLGPRPSAVGWMDPVLDGPGTAGARARFERATVAVVARLPGRLREIVAPTLVGFAAINGSTFCVDMLLVTLFRSGLGWPLWLAVGCGYALALALSFVLNRVLNFRTHGPVGRQLVRWAGVVVVNYAGIVVGVTVGLAALGVPYPVARLVAGLMEAGFMYSGMRWVVFSDRPLWRIR